MRAYDNDVRRIRSSVEAVLIAIAVFVLSFNVGGCASKPEMAWQALHAFDVAQTLSIVGDPCYVELDPVTVHLIGPRPSKKGVIMWGVGLAGLHAGVTHLLDRFEAPRWTQVTWHVVNIVSLADIVHGNYQVGLRVSGSNKMTADNGCTL